MICMVAVGADAGTCVSLRGGLMAGSASRCPRPFVGGWLEEAPPVTMMQGLLSVDGCSFTGTAKNNCAEVRNSIIQQVAYTVQ